jgi:hypothetical protein
MRISLITQKSLTLVHKDTESEICHYNHEENKCVHICIIQSVRYFKGRAIHNDWAATLA